MKICEKIEQGEAYPIHLNEEIKEQFKNHMREIPIEDYIVLCEVSKCPYNYQSEEKIFYGESRTEDNLVNICKTKGFILKKS
jgi:hypothetical protein